MGWCGTVGKVILLRSTRRALHWLRIRAAHPGHTLWLQVWHAVLRSERPPIPPRIELPGPGAEAFDGLEPYLQLMR